jgi:regulator of RNase E activity RraA
MDNKIGYRIIEDIIRPSKELLERLRKFSAPELCDNPLASKRKICGPVITVKLSMGDSLIVTKAIDIAKPGDVNGVCVIPADFAEQIMENAKKKINSMALVKREILDQGKVLPANYAEQLKKMGYMV